MSWVLSQFSPFSWWVMSPSSKNPFLDMCMSDGRMHTRKLLHMDNNCGLGFISLITLKKTVDKNISMSQNSIQIGWATFNIKSIIKLEQWRFLTTIYKNTLAIKISIGGKFSPTHVDFIYNLIHWKDFNVAFCIADWWMLFEMLDFWGRLPVARTCGGVGLFFQFICIYIGHLYETVSLLIVIFVLWEESFNEKCRWLFVYLVTFVSLHFLCWI